MKKMYYESLPNKNGRISWKDTVGKRVKFEFDELDGEVLITDYIPNGKHPKIEISFEGNNKIIDVEVFKRCCIQKIIEKPLSDFCFNLGDRVGNLQVIDREYKKTKRIKKQKQYTGNFKIYTCRCKKCNQICTKEESLLKKGIGCPVCNSKRVVKGINDIATTHPELLNYFKNKEDANRHSFSSDKKVLVLCPTCKEEKYMAVKVLSKNGIGCVCGDGFSYPEKFIYSLLKQQNIKFKKQYSPNWANKKRYDFYLDDYELILEIHGEQHYTNSFVGCGGDSLEEVMENDKIKKELASQNGISKYIELNCSKSSLEFIKESIFNSELRSIINFDDVDWKKCDKESRANIINEICVLWNECGSTTEIKEKLHMSRTTIVKYLKIGAELNMCDYDAEASRNKGLAIGRTIK